VRRRRRMRTSVLIDGKETPIELRMWSKKKRDDIEREYGIPGATYVSMVVGSLSQGRGPAQQLAKDLIDREVRRQNEVGDEFNMKMISAVAFKVLDGDPPPPLLPFKMEEIENFPDGEYERLRSIVTNFLLGNQDKFTMLKVGLADKIKDDALREDVLKFVNEVASGQVEVKN